jgi:hypothetical protein
LEPELSIFSFPRLHFWGTQYVNPGTGNNNSLGPGTEITVTVNTEQVAPITSDLDDADFFTWMQGLDPNGLLRAQWNYFGDMSFRFGDANAQTGETGPAEFVRIVSAELAPNDLRSDPKTEPLIGARVSLRSSFVCDVNPEGFDCTQIFAGALEINAPGALGGKGIFLSRRPTRAVTRSLNWYRNASFHAAVDPTSGGAGGASASFIHSIKVSPGDLEPLPDRGLEYDEMLHHWWPQEATSGRPQSPAAGALHKALKQPGVRGLQIRYNLYLTYPRISDADLNKDFAAGIRTENPAIGWVLGTIAPWFEGEPESLTVGRYLKPATSYVNKYRSDGKPYYIAPAVAHYNEASGTLSVDLINSLPEDGKSGEKFGDLGEFSIGVRAATLPGADPSQNTATVTTIGAVVNEKNYFEQHGGMYDWVVTDKAVRALLEDPNRELVLSSSNCGVLSFEPEFFIGSDCEAAYLDEAPSGSPNRVIRPEPRRHHRVDPLCGLVPVYVRRRGRVPKDGVALRVEQWKFTPSGDRRRPGLYVWPSQLGVEELAIAGGYGMHELNPVDGPGVRMFRYVAPGQWPQPMTGEQVGQFAFQEFYTFLRVLPHDAAAAAIAHDKVDYDAVYRHVFRYYALILPAMSKRLNMTAESGSAWATPTAAQYLLMTTDPDLWDHWAYMPRTRDLSSTRRELLRQFCKNVLAGQSPPAT